MNGHARPVVAPKTALVIVDLQNDFLHPEGAYARGGDTNPPALLLPARVATVARALKASGGMVLASQFTLWPDPSGEPMVSPHLRQLRPYLRKGDFAPGSWGQGNVDALAGLVDVAVCKVAYSAFFNTQLDWLLRRAGIDTLAVCGIVTNGGVASTVRDAHMRDYRTLVLADGCAAFSEERHQVALADMRSVAEERLRGLRPVAGMTPHRNIRRASRIAADAHAGVAIVGAGACGLTTALMLHDAGVDCVVLERDAVPTGSTALSSGFIPAVGTRVQRAHGVAGDSVELFVRDIQAKAHGRAAGALAAAYAQAAGPALDALEARHGLEWTLLDGFLYPDHSLHRMHSLPQKTGAALMAGLLSAVAAAGIPVLTQALVDTLWLDAQDHLVGIGFQRPDGREERLACDALVVACNGFGGNAQMVRSLLPAMADAAFAGHAGNDGSAILWGEALGARLRDLGGYQGHGSWVTPQGALMSWAVMMEGGVQLNCEGRRFHDETQGYSEAAVQVLQQPGSIAWNVFDAPLLALARGFPDFCEAEAAGALRQCESVAGLAACIGCDAAVLQATLESLYTSSPQPDGRISRRPLAAPYYAVKVTGALFHTQGGLDIDADTRVLRQDGSAMPNLFAAGGAAGGVSGDAVWGYLSGNGLLSAVAGGYIAARSAAALIHPARK